jgi:hypothetical protein
MSAEVEAVSQAISDQMIYSVAVIAVQACSNGGGTTLTGIDKSRGD